jgi:NADPH:quinone reductase-like Zn-dependent oxidoreductase
VVAQKGGFAGVIDPYCDLYLAHMPAVMAVGGRYTSCGYYDQYLGLIGRERPPLRVPLGQLPGLVLIKNLSIIGNCIGLTADLDQALRDFAAGQLAVRIDRVYRGTDTAAFLERTYNASDRFGKVVYAYN